MADEHSGGRALKRQYVKLCDLADFDDPKLRTRIREIVPGLDPHEELHRKYWEFALLTLFLDDVGRLTDSTRVLAVGAGHEAVLYWLATRVGHVLATDIYGDGAFADREADRTMLDNPAAFAPYPYPEDRLEARWMDARSLDFPDGHFDVVFTLSSIEHFGPARDIAKAARELGRVLKPGGHAFITTECYVARHPLHSRLVQTAARLVTRGRYFATATPLRRTDEVFTREELRLFVVRPSRLELLQPVDRTLSPATWGNIIHLRGSEYGSESGDPFPHILLKTRSGAAWTSVSLALEKPPL